MKLNPSKHSQLEYVGKMLRLDYIRVFGSALKSWAKARDIDLVISSQKDLGLRELSLLHSELQKIFHKRPDIVLVRRSLSPTLVKVIASTSHPLWENPKNGRQTYI